MLPLVVMLFACEGTRSLPTQSIQRDFGPDSGAADVVTGAGVRIRWWQGNYNSSILDSGLRETVLTRFRGDTIVTTARVEYLTDFELPFGAGFQLLVDALAQEIDTVAIFDSMPFPVHVANKRCDVILEGKFENFSIPITAYRDSLVAGTWEKVAHATSTLRYRRFYWLVDYAQCAHDQGAGG